jgi:DNA invertase Pin-like site-specific DNA recombinase
MNERNKITAGHLSRQAIVYLRQSSAAQVEHNRESTDRQYALTAKARELGWPDDRIIIIDEDLGVSGSGAVVRSGFQRLTAEVALSRVGLVLGLEVSRLACNNADWHRLIDLAGLTDTLIGDADGIYHPALINDRLLLGLKGTMSEAELHVLRGRLNGGIRNKAARGELRRGLPVGFVWGEADGEVCFHPDEAVTAIRPFEFAGDGSARRVIGHGSARRACPAAAVRPRDIRWVERATPLSTTCSPTPSMPVPTPLAKPARRRRWMRLECAASAYGIYRVPSGRCSSRSIIQDSSTGRPMRPIRHAWRGTRDPDRTRWAVP